MTTREPATDFRKEAAAKLKSALDLLHKNEPDLIFYACLDARMAIEALSYNILMLYRSQVGYDIMYKWQPSKVIAELCEIDTEAAARLELSFIVPNTGKVVELGHEHRFSAAWARKAHSALGSFLHFPTLKQIEEAHTLEKHKDLARKKVKEVCDELVKVLESPIINFKAERLAIIQCECGFKIGRSPEYLLAQKSVICSECAREWGYDLDEKSNRVRWYLMGFQLGCPHCSKKQKVRSKHELREGAEFECEFCKGKFGVVREFALKKN